jgi:hypothetical protein
MDQEMLNASIEVDRLFESRPELFSQPIPSFATRRTMFVGELVKVLTGIREDEKLVSGKWLVIESVSRNGDDLKAIGRSWKQFHTEDFWYTFGPENIYRMEPRWFFLWGNDGFPIALRSGGGPDGREPVHPLDKDEQRIEGCKDVLLEFAAIGWNAAKAHYNFLVKENVNWPSLDDLV